MTAIPVPPAVAAPAAPPKRPWLRPSTVLPAVAVVIAIVVLMTPQSADDSDFRLTTYSAGSFGARALYDMLTQLGWRTSRLRAPLKAPFDTTAVYVLLSPIRPLSEREDSALVRMVRAGGRLIVASADSNFTAPFGMWAKYQRRGSLPLAQLSVAGDSHGVIHRNDRLGKIFSQNILSQSTTVVNVLPTQNDTLAVFLWRSSWRAHRADRSTDSASASPIVLGHRLGQGRVVLIGDPMLLHNDVLREGRPALAVQRALEWLNPPSRRVIFDEYHQGFGPQTPNQLDVVINALTDTALGHVGLQLIVASLIVLFAVGARAILPTPVTILPRRSPLEHVDALARAYEQIHATRLATRRLVRGLRRRHPMGTVKRISHEDDVAYLEAIRIRYGIAANDVEAVTKALRTKVSDDELHRVGQTIARIEQAILQSIHPA